jgi:hypothetical protein
VEVASAVRSDFQLGERLSAPDLAGRALLARFILSRLGGEKRLAR